MDKRSAGVAHKIVEAMQESFTFLLEDPHIDSALAQAEAVRYMTRLVVGATKMELENHDPAYPHFHQMFSPFSQWGLNNPDYVYLTAPLHGDYSYRVFGQRGSAHFLSFEIFEGDFSDTGQMHVGASKLHLSNGAGDFEVTGDGNVELVLSRRERPGNWMPIPAGRSLVFMRIAYYDWENETPPLIYIEREGASYPPPLLSADQLFDDLGYLHRFLIDQPRNCAKGAARHFDAEPRSVPFPPLALGATERDHADQIGFKDQYFGQGHYRCGADECVILEVTPPRCAYWGFHLASLNWEATEWHMRQSSINGHQAFLDRDGVFRAVIAHRDPGVPNWLDTGGRTVGLIAGRYNRPDTVPVPTLRVLPLNELRNALPPDTPDVTLEQRSETLRRRMLSVRRRNAD